MIINHNYHNITINIINTGSNFNMNKNGGININIQ